MLKGELRPDAGSIRFADELRIVSFDQQREQLDQQQSLKQALAPASETVMFRGQSMHVTSWARRFLFPPEKLVLPVAQLSGGEQARVLLARLMLRPADILLLDEPTNDLDIPTLEMLEESLSDFPGAIVLITHDRFLMNRLSDGLLYLNGKGGVVRFADYEQWLAHRPAESAEPAPAKPKPQAKKTAPRMSYAEQKELGRIEKKIEKAEQEVGRLEAQLHDPAFMSDAERLQELHAELQTAQEIVDQLYKRWDELEQLKQTI